MTEYPCPVCVGTMPPGFGPMSLGKMLEKGSGKVYQPYSGAASMSGTIPEGTWGECYRCHGSGLVDERRRGVPERRAQHLVKTPEAAQRMVAAIHSAVHTLDQTGERYKASCLRELAEAAYAYTGHWLTRGDYGNVKPRWMGDGMWESLRDPTLHTEKGKNG